MAKMTRERARAIFEKLSAANPAPETELYFKNPFTLVVAVALSAQATDVGVNRATKTLFEIADTPEKMAALGEKKLGDYIKTIGLWRNKAKNVIALSQKLIDEFASRVPETREELETLPGVGRKTANVVMNVAFGQPTIAVDTHIFRVGNRTGLAPGRPGMSRPAPVSSPKAKAPPAVRTTATAEAPSALRTVSPPRDALSSRSCSLLLPPRFRPKLERTGGSSGSAMAARAASMA